MSNRGNEIAKIVDNYIKRLEHALQDIPKEEMQDISNEIRAHIEDSIKSSDGNLETIHAILEDLGEPEQCAADLKEEGSFATKSNHVFKLKSSGRILGMPYDFGRPTLNKIAERMWAPSDPRILRSKAFGIGWAINFGAIAVKLRILRPDDEEGVPFSNVPDRALSIGMFVSIVINLVAVIIAAIYLNKLPARVPIHFGVTKPDRFSSPIGATLWWVGLPVLLTAIASYFTFIRRKSRLARVLAITLLTSFSALCLGAYIDSVYYALNNIVIIHPGILVVAVFAIVFLVLVVFSKLGLREEWRRINVE